ncbi:MAG: hypothetical protein ACYCS4_03895 [Acidimicrobiales bacterium]
MSAPMVPGILSGAIGVTTALERYLIALVGCWVGGAIISGILTRYQAGPEAGSLHERQASQDFTTAPSVGPYPQGQAPLVRSPESELPGAPPAAAPSDPARGSFVSPGAAPALPGQPGPAASAAAPAAPSSGSEGAAGPPAR